MSTTRNQAVENGLMTAISIPGTTQKNYRLMDRMEYYHVPGVSIAVINHEKIEWAQGYGLLEMNGNIQVSPDTLFQAASISKPVSAAIVLKHVEQGKLDLDINVNTYLSSWQIPENEFTEKNPVTLRGILSHTAGLTVHGFRGYSFDAEVPSLLQILKGELPANSEPIQVDVVPGSIYRYSGGGFTVVQQLLEDMTNTTFEELLRTEVLDPLNMHDSSFEQPLPARLGANAASGHRGTGMPLEGKWHTYPEEAAAGLWTTPTDVAEFTIEIIKSSKNRSNRIFSAGMANSMLAPVKGNYGLGFELKKIGNHLIRFGHVGSNEGFRCYLAAYKGSGSGAVVMTNGANGNYLTMEIMRSIAKIYEWPDFLPREKQAVQGDPGIYHRYVGKYQLPAYPDYTVQVKKEGTRLFLERIEDATCWELYPESEVKYFFVESEHTVEFEKNNDGVFDALTLGSQMRLKKFE
jgi:CubicO group peptidase (beta-lactamase class C family)